MTTISVDAIEVGDRYRKDLGDIASLAESIDRLGMLLHPIVVTADHHQLIVGQRRLEAVRSLGWDEVEVTVAHSLTDVAALLEAERDENTCRKPMLRTEEHSLYEALLEIEKAEARERQGQRTDLTLETSGKNSRKLEPKPEQRSRELTAKAVTGTAGAYRTLEKVGDVKKIEADPATPEPVKAVARQALRQMDETGKVDGAHRAVQIAAGDAALGSVLDAIDRRNPDAKAERTRATLRADYSKAIAGVAALLPLSVEKVSAVLSDTETDVLVGTIRSAVKWAEQVQSTRHRTGLTVLNGGQA